MKKGKRAMSKACRSIYLLPLVLGALAMADDAAAQNCPTMRKINIGVSVAPPNVVHTSPYVAKDLGFFAKRCIEPNIIQFEGGQSATSAAAAAQGSAIVSVGDVAIGRGLKVQQFWGLAPRMPQAYMVSPDIKTAADLKGRKLSATGGGVGGFNWRMGREVLKTAGLTVDDAQFISSATAGRLPGLVAGQIDGVALHPEDVYLAKKQKPALNLLVQLVELMPDYMFNAYGASLEWIGRDRALLRDVAAAMIEANRMMYNDKAKVVPSIEKATDKPKEAVEYAIDVLTKNCVWSVNGGLDPKRTAWTVDNSAENGDIDKDKKPSAEQVANFALAKEAVDAAGGPVSIGNCKD
jgi:ABC-type nitrate/sulfonate/bicarbonate transport system substrate-binding protein